MLAQAVELTGCGHPPRLELIDQVLGEMNKHSMLDAREFVKFLYRYQAIEHHFIEDSFARFDKDGNNLVDDADFGALLAFCGITPVEKVLWELRIEVAQQSCRGFNFEEFRRAVDLVSERQGFPRREAERLRQVFAKFGRHGSRSLDSNELNRILGWLGYADRREAAAIAAEVGLHADGANLTEYDFLVVMRKVRERELQCLTDFIAQADGNRNGLIDNKELKQLLHSLGYQPSPEAIEDAAEDILGGSPKPPGRPTSASRSFPPRHTGQVLCSAAFKRGRSATLGADLGREYSLTELWNFVELYRARDGFSRAEVAEIEDAFQKYDRDEEGDISTLEVGKVLRWLGYQTSWESQQLLVSEVDIDHSGRLDAGELRKLMRKYRERDLGAIVQAFKEHDFDGTGMLPRKRVGTALRSLGFTASTDDGSDSSGGSESSTSRGVRGDKDDDSSGDESRSLKGVDLDRFVQRAVRLRGEERTFFRKNVGFSWEQVERMRERFKRFDLDDSGAIGNSELRGLLEDCFPSLATSRKLRPYLLKILQEAEAHSGGELDFPDFLRLMRQVHDLQERDTVKKEQTAVRELKFKYDEVEGFRELFMEATVAPEGCDRLAAELPFADLARMVGRVCPLGDRNMAHLIDICADVIGARGAAADFPDFLRLMRRLLDVNFANLEEHTRGAAGGPGQQPRALGHITSRRFSAGMVGLVDAVHA